MIALPTSTVSSLRAQPAGRACHRILLLVGLMASLASGALAAANAATATPVPARTVPSAFADTSLDAWEERSFAGNTRYSLVDQNGLRVLQASTDGQASVLYRERDIRLSNTPWLNWSWKIQAPYDNPDELSRTGDDFPARLYVAVKTGFLPWETLALNYVWSSSNEIGSDWANPYTDKAHMVVVNSGTEHAGQWVRVQRNLRDDFKRYFGVDIKRINGYAVMVDGDNTGARGLAWFGAIEFTPQAVQIGLPRGG